MRQVTTFLLLWILLIVPMSVAAQTPGTASAATVETATPPEAFILYQNYPNPFNPETAIRYTLRVPARVRLAVYDMLGREVAVLVDAEQGAGAHQARWNGTDEKGNDMPSGMYLYRLQVDQQSAVRTMLLLR